MLSDKFSYTDNGKEEGLFIASFIEEPDIQKQKVVSLAEEKVRYRVANYNIKELCIDNYIELIQKSSLVITDSNAIVHLAIVYKKPAILSRNKKKSLEVISTLEQLGLEERIIFVEDDVKEKSYLYKKPIKYGVVDYKLKAFIEHSKEWLGKCLE